MFFKILLDIHYAGHHYHVSFTNTPINITIYLDELDIQQQQCFYITFDIIV